MKLEGIWSATVYGPNGEIKSTFSDSHNVITTNGKEYVADFLNTATCSAAAFDMDHIAVGTDNTGETVSDTSLGVELVRNTATVSYTSGGIYELTTTFTTGQATGAVVEYGVFSSSTGGTMLSRDTESVINVGANDTLTVTCQITFS